MLSREKAIRDIKVGDIVYGIAGDSQPKLLLVYEADENSFSARHMTSQSTARFGRDGEAFWTPGDGSCTIVSTAELPPEQREVAIALDRRMGTKPEYPDSRLTEDEIYLILRHAEFFEARLLAGTEAFVRRAQLFRAVERVLSYEWDPVTATDNPPSLYEYSDYLTALVELLEKPRAQDEIARFLSELAVQKKRPQSTLDRVQAATASLLRLSHDAKP